MFIAKSQLYIDFFVFLYLVHLRCLFDYCLKFFRCKENVGFFYPAKPILIKDDLL